ncbi:hypothetical protein ACQR1N_00005, partial [Bradyrhizobium sp. HKCCYLRH1073]|uniref:hypothetical protein n=1 Tax=unclassified Bradyrhizobium TaxID=2631580 RepID=UPI003EBC95B4
MLDETWKDFWKIRIEGASIDPLCGTSDDLGTASCSIARRAVSMRSAATFHYACSKQVIMDKSVHNHHGPSSFEPDGPLGSCPQAWCSWRSTAFAGWSRACQLAI